MSETISQSKGRDIVYLNGVQCPCVVGVYEWEQHLKQTLVLDIELRTDTRTAAEHDDLKDALDYQAVAQCAQRFCADNHFKLIETLIERLAEKILTDFNTPWIRIKLDKGKAVAGVSNVGLVIERHAQNSLTLV